MFFCDIISMLRHPKILIKFLIIHQQILQIFTILNLGTITFYYIITYNMQLNLHA